MIEIDPNKMVAWIGELEIARRAQAEQLAARVFFTAHEGAQLAQIVEHLHREGCICSDGHDCPTPELSVFLDRLRGMS